MLNDEPERTVSVPFTLRRDPDRNEPMLAPLRKETFADSFVQKRSCVSHPSYVPSGTVRSEPGNRNGSYNPSRTQFIPVCASIPSLNSQCVSMWSRADSSKPGSTPVLSLRKVK